MLKADLTKFKRLMELYQTYQKQANSNERTIYSLHDDSDPGDPDYHCDTHDNYVVNSKVKIKVKDNVTN